MIRITDINGATHALHRDAIARLTEAGTSSRWHGIKTIVRLFDGKTIEAQEELSVIQQRVDSERSKGEA